MHPQSSVKIIGIDPGLRKTGWGIIESYPTRMAHIAHGVISSSDSLDLAQRLVQLYNNLVHVMETYNPLEAAIEETFVNKNPLSTLKLGMARGVVLMTPAKWGISVHEYSANRIKKAVVGAGHAGKEQVAMMVKTLLPSVGNISGDAADALATAICHAHYRQTTLNTYAVTYETLTKYR